MANCYAYGAGGTGTGTGTGTAAAPMAAAPPDYCRLGEGFYNRYGVCRVFGANLDEPYGCHDWLNKAEVYIWNDRTGGVFDCSTINDKICNTCCEIVAALIKWHNLRTGLTVCYSLLKHEGDRWVTKPLCAPEGVVYETRITIPNPADYGYSYWSWMASSFYCGTWKRDCASEITGDGTYCIRIREEDGKFDTQYLYFDIANLRQLDLKFNLDLRVYKAGSYYVGTEVEGVGMQWHGPYNLSTGEQSIAPVMRVCPVSGRARAVVADTAKNVIGEIEKDYDFEWHEY